MPPHTRSQRRRQNARQPRPTASAEATSRAPSTSTTVPLDNPIEMPVELPARPAVSASTRPPATRRRVISRPAPEPVDYSKDYAAARIDLRRIAIWAVLLFVVMIALKFSGLV